MKTLTPACRNKLYGLLLSTILLAAGSAFATVWMQQQIGRCADRGQRSEALLAETVRKLRHLDERIAALHQPALLQGRVAGKMRPSEASQMVLVRPEDLPGGRSRALAQEPRDVSLDLAFIDLRAKP